MRSQQDRAFRLTTAALAFIIQPRRILPQRSPSVWCNLPEGRQRLVATLALISAR